MTDPAIRIEGLGKEYATRRGRFRAVDGLSLRVEPGEIFGLLGPNGAGKTTTIRMLCGLLRPSEGEAWVEGVSVLRDPVAARKKIGLVPEDAGQHANLTVAEELVYHGALHGLRPRDTLARAAPLLRRLQLADRTHHRLKTFSRGMKRKVHLIRALLHEPSILLLDEPTAGLDPDVTLEVWEILQTLVSERRATVVLCSHHLEEVQKLCKRIAIIKGRLLAEGTPAALSGANGRYSVKLARRESGVGESSAAPWSQIAGGVAGATGVESFDSTLRFTCAGDPERVVPEVVRALAAAGAPILAVQPQEGDLRALYRRIVQDEPASEGHGARDTGAAGREEAHR